MKRLNVRAELGDDETTVRTVGRVLSQGEEQPSCDPRHRPALRQRGEDISETILRLAEIEEQAGR
jgi:hypothetical protein